MESWMPGWWGLLVLAGAVLAVVNWLAQRRAVQPAHCPPAKPAKPANKKQPLLDLPDMEDLSRPVRSLIPETVRRMKADGVAPYTATDRRSRLDELNAHPEIPNFAGVLIKHGQKLQRTATTVLQANIGLYCNQACTHCHVDSSPKRKEMMSREVTDRCIELIRNSPSVKVVDLTGGAPEMNREFRRWVTGCRELGLHVIDRCNLTVLLEPTQPDLGQFLADNQVHVIASLPCYLEGNVDGQRGDHVFERSIAGLKLLNRLGYGKGGDLRLDLVYNPTGVHLPPAQPKLESAYKRHLMESYAIEFDSLVCITNMPINRFYDHLKDQGQLDKYMNILYEGFNPDTCQGLMCRDYLSIKWDGEIYDCDFNQQVELPPKAQKRLTVFDIDTTDDLLQACQPASTGLDLCARCQ